MKADDWLKVRRMAFMLQRFSNTFKKKDALRLYGTGNQYEVLRSVSGSMFYFNFEDPLQQSFYMAIKDAVWKYIYHADATGAYPELMLDMACQGVLEASKYRSAGLTPNEALKAALEASRASYVTCEDSLEVDSTIRDVYRSIPPYTEVTFLDGEELDFQLKPYLSLKSRVDLSPPVAKTEIRSIGNYLVFLADTLSQDSYERILNTFNSAPYQTIIFYKEFINKDLHDKFVNFCQEKDKAIQLVKTTERKGFYKKYLREVIERGPEDDKELRLRLLSEGFPFMYRKEPVACHVGRESIYIKVNDKLPNDVVERKSDPLEDVAEGGNVEVFTYSERNDAIKLLSKLNHTHLFVTLPKGKESRPDKIHYVESMFKLARAEHEPLVRVTFGEVDRVIPHKDLVVMNNLIHSLLVNITFVEVFVENSSTRR